MSTHSHLVRPVSRLFRRLTVLGVASAAVVGAGVGVGVQPAGAAGTTVYVSSSATSDPSCASASQTNPFATIQQALVCAPSGSTVLVGSGTFVGQVTVNRNVNLQGAGPTTVIRRSPGFTNLAANVTVTDGRTVTLQNLTVDGVDRTTAGVAAGSGHLTLRDVDVVNNGNVFGNAGGLSVSPASGTATVLVLNSTIANNSAAGAGGGIYVSSRDVKGSSLTVLNSTISGNVGSGGYGNGGGIYVGLSSLSVRDSTIVANTTGGSGGGVSTDSTPFPVSLINTIVAGNNAPSSSAGPDCSISTNRAVSGRNNLIGQNSGQATSGCAAFTNGVNGNQVGTAAAPLDAVLGPLADNGGQTLTRAPLSGSPAINSGDPADCQATPVSGRDQRHLSRNTANRLACDIGSYDTAGTPVQHLYVSASATSDPSCASASQANPFHTVAAALACSADGATVTLGKGTFTGQVAVNANVILEGAGARTTVLRRTPGFANLAANVTVAEDRVVTIRGLTIDGADRVAPGVASGRGRLNLRDVNVVNNGNLFGGAGGGLSVAPTTGTATVSVLDSTIANNSADGAGAGIYVSSHNIAGSSLTVLNSTISGNGASGGNSDGGGIYVGVSSLTVRDSTIVANSTSSGSGGGIATDSYPFPVSLTNTILAGNTASSSTAGPDCSISGNRTATGGHNVIGQDTGQAVTGCLGFTNGVNGNQVGTASAPLDPKVGPLANSGGQTLTRPLLSGSPAINAGDTGDCQAAPIANRDQRHSSRNVTTRDFCDVGSYDTGSTTL